MIKEITKDWAFHINEKDNLYQLFHTPCFSRSEMFYDKPEICPNGYRNITGGWAYYGTCDTCHLGAADEVLKACTPIFMTFTKLTDHGKKIRDTLQGIKNDTL